MDASIKSIKCEITTKGGLRLFPERFVTDVFKEAVKALTVEQIEKRIGSFYVMRLDLGGQIRKSYTMQATQSDTEASIKAELTAAYGSSMLGANATAHLGVLKRASNKNADMRVEWSAKGGNTTLWLGKQFKKEEADAVSNIQEEWAKSFTDDNLYPFNYQLGLMWEIIEKIDHDKGVAFKEYLEKKWEANKNMFRPSKYLTGEY